MDNVHDRLHVVLGATGGAGGALVEELARRGHRVRAVSRNPAADLAEGVERVAADVADPTQARRACQGATVVYHCVQPPYERWAVEFPPLTQSIAQAAASAGARLVFADNLYAYGPVQGPMTEELPALATTRKGRIRARMAERLLEAHRAGTLQVAIGRSSDYYGPGGANSVVGEVLFGAAVQGRRARWLGRLDVPHTLNYLSDVARALATLGERPQALGGVWHLPAAEPLTGRGFVELIAAALGRPVRVTATSRLALRVAGVVDARARESAEMLYQWERPFVVDAAKFQGAFGPFEPTPHQRAVAATVAWFQQRADRTPR
ncbi:MAG TPA: NAD-dependent epimerase/dehydratase family protein [Actinomycetes bacterium]|jgi:nucleoside-diphosphate-sugar epimerase|nr:NAD-dependent epimerase/dehydratase family protein [Actinomycetes bacterium]